MSLARDENKNRANRAKHGIDFDFAGMAFDDSLALTTQDRDIDGEQTIPVDRRVLYADDLVAHTVRVNTQTGSTEEEPVIRIISARKVTPAERKLYEEKAAN